MRIVILISFLICITAIVFGLRKMRRTRDASVQFVKVYDFQTREILTIPAAELAPGMVRVKLESGDIVWAKASEFKQGPLRHPPFEGAAKELVVRIQKTLEEVYPHTYEFWEDGFRRDTEPEREIALWLHIAGIFESFSEPRTTTIEEERKPSGFLLRARMEQKKRFYRRSNFRR